MVITPKVKKYLTGEIISNGHCFKIRKAPLVSRDHLLVSISKNKRVIHLGCADHIELINEKRKLGKYLHDLLLESSDRLVGVDTNVSALEEMKNNGFTDLYVDTEFPRNDRYDVLLVPDVIEHVPNVSSFLIDLHSYNVELVVITTPNSYRLMNRLQFGGELINTDHRYWFSPYTLSKVLYENGFNVDKLIYTDTLAYKNPIQSYLKWMYPLCRDGLAVIARNQPQFKRKHC